MKKVILLSTIVLGMSAWSFAQEAQKPMPPNADMQRGNADMKRPPMPPEARAKRKAAHLQHELGLKPEQTEKIFQTFMKFYKQRDMLENNKATMQKQEFHEQAKALAETRDNELKSILTPEQFAKMEEMKKNQKPMPNGEMEHEDEMPQPHRQ
jgi:periplasmic protein CpxP/Spy